MSLKKVYSKAETKNSSIVLNPKSNIINPTPMTNPPIPFGGLKLAKKGFL